MKCPYCQSGYYSVHSRRHNRLRCGDCSKTWRVAGEEMPPAGWSPKRPELVEVTPAPSGMVVDPEDPNTATVTSTPVRDPDTVPTLESVLAEFCVDLDEWVPEAPIINRWEMGYTDDAGNPGAYPLYQVKVKLRRATPVAVGWPIFRAAQVAAMPPVTFAISRQLRRAVIMPDVQAGFRRDVDTGELDPFHDPVACAAFAGVVAAVQPDALIAVGDNLDLPEISRYAQEPEFYFTTQAALDWLAGYLWMLRPHVGDQCVYLEGNHEARLPTYIATNALFAARLRRADRERLTGGGAASRPILSVPYLLGLDEMDIAYVGDYPRGRFWLNDNLRVSHSERLGTKSGMSVSRSLDGARCSLIFGHSHRLEAAHQTVHARDKARVYGAYNVGTLARIDGAVPSNSADANWQQGFGVVDYSESGKQLHSVQLVPIYGGECIFEGAAYAATEEVVSCLSAL